MCARALGLPSSTSSSWWDLLVRSFEVDQHKGSPLLLPPRPQQPSRVRRSTSHWSSWVVSLQGVTFEVSFSPEGMEQTYKKISNISLCTHSMNAPLFKLKSSLACARIQQQQHHQLFCCFFFFNFHNRSTVEKTASTVFFFSIVMSRKKKTQFPKKIKIRIVDDSFVI